MLGVKFPFSVGSGSVVTTANPAEIIQSKILFLLSTKASERVMRPNWGLDLMNAVHALGGEWEEALEESIRTAFTDHFPEYEVREVTSRRDRYNPTLSVVEVRYGKFDSALDQTARAGVVVGDSEIFDDEGL